MMHGIPSNAERVADDVALQADDTTALGDLPSEVGQRSSHFGTRVICGRDYRQSSVTLALRMLNLRTRHICNSGAMHCLLLGWMDK